MSKCHELKFKDINGSTVRVFGLIIEKDEHHVLLRSGRGREYYVALSEILLLRETTFEFREEAQP